MRYVGIALVMLMVSGPSWAGNFPLGVWGIWMSGEQYDPQTEKYGGEDVNTDFDNVKALGVKIIGGGIQKYYAEAKYHNLCSNNNIKLIGLGRPWTTKMSKPYPWHYLPDLARMAKDYNDDDSLKVKAWKEAVLACIDSTLNYIDSTLNYGGNPANIDTTKGFVAFFLPDRL